MILGSLMILAGCWILGEAVYAWQLAKECVAACQLLPDVYDEVEEDAKRWEDACR